MQPCSTSRCLPWRALLRRAGHPGDGRRCIVPGARKGTIQAAILIRMSSLIAHGFVRYAAEATRPSPPSNASLQAEIEGPYCPRCFRTS